MRSLPTKSAGLTMLTMSKANSLLLKEVMNRFLSNSFLNCASWKDNFPNLIQSAHQQN